METIGTRIKRLRLEMSPRLTQKDLAARLGIRPPSVFLWESDNTKPSGENLLALANVLNTTPEAILGIKPYKRGEPEETNWKLPRTINRAPIIASSVPLISSVQAGDWADANDTYHPGDGAAWQIVTVTVGPHAYALRVEGKSMHNPNGAPSIPEGSIVVVDPDAPALNGKIVIAKMLDSGEVTIKRFSKDGADCYLEPLNPDYKPTKMNANHVIIGVVRQIVQEL